MAEMAVQLQTMLTTLDQVGIMLIDFEKTGDKTIQTAITKEMKGLTPLLKVLLSNPECRSKGNLHLLVEVSNRAKEMVEKTKSFPSMRAALTQPHTDSQSVPTPLAPYLSPQHV